MMLHSTPNMASQVPWYVPSRQGNSIKSSRRPPLTRTAAENGVQAFPWEDTPTQEGTPKQHPNKRHDSLSAWMAVKHGSLQFDVSPCERTLPPRPQPLGARSSPRAALGAECAILVACARAISGPAFCSDTNGCKDADIIEMSAPTFVDLHGEAPEARVGRETIKKVTRLERK